MVFEWKRNMAVKADVAHEELERIRNKNNDGILIPSEIRDESRPEDAILHKLFEWDDWKAAEAYRENQASFIIRNLTVKVEDENIDEPIITRQYVITAHNSYQPIMEAMADVELREMLLEAARSELLAFQAKYRHLKELAKLMDAIDDQMESTA